MKYYCENIDTVLEKTESSAQGLSTEEAERRLLQNGRNKLAEGKKDSIFVRFLKLRRNVFAYRHLFFKK